MTAMEEKMLIRKFALGTLLLTCPWIVSADDAVKQQQQQQRSSQAAVSIDELRRRCEGFRADDQIMPFSIDIACKGNYTYWERENGFFALHNEGNMSFATSTKGDRFGTQPGYASGPRQKHGGACYVYSKRQMSTEGASLTLDSITDCAELTVENIYRLCEEAVHDYCDGNYSVDTGSHAQQQPSQAQQQQQQQRCDGKSVL